MATAIEVGYYHSFPGETYPKFIPLCNTGSPKLSTQLENYTPRLRRPNIGELVPPESVLIFDPWFDEGSCNLSCAHCIPPSALGLETDLWHFRIDPSKLHSAMDILNQKGSFGQQGFTSVRIGGNRNEPTKNDFLPQYVRTIREFTSPAEADMWVITNGTTLPHGDYSPTAITEYLGRYFGFDTLPSDFVLRISVDHAHEAAYLKLMHEQNTLPQEAQKLYRQKMKNIITYARNNQRMQNIIFGAVRPANIDVVSYEARIRENYCIPPEVQVDILTRSRYAPRHGSLRNAVTLDSQQTPMQSGRRHIFIGGTPDGDVRMYPDINGLCHQANGTQVEDFVRYGFPKPPDGSKGDTTWYRDDVGNQWRSCKAEQMVRQGSSSIGKSQVGGYLVDDGSSRQRFVPVDELFGLVPLGSGQVNLLDTIVE